MSVTGEARRPAVVTAAATMLAVGGVLFAGETYLAEERFFKASDIHGAVGELANMFHRLAEILGIFAGLAVALLAAPAFLGLSWARTVSWIFGLPMLIWYGLTGSLSALGRMVNGPGSLRYGHPGWTRWTPS